MANVPLRSITFPGLTDVYTVAKTDTTLAIAGEPADAKATGDALAATGDALAAKAESNGSYEGLTAGSAEQLLATTGAEDMVPYTLRQTGGGVAVGDRAEEKIVGGTIAWNQLVDSGTTSVTLTSSRKYISYIGGTWACGASDGTALTVTGGTDMVFDITQMFTGTVADAVYAMEQATAGAGVAWFRAMFPESYYPYNAGELMSVQTSGKRVTGFNQWNEDWELGGINTNGNDYSSSSIIRSKGYTPIIPGKTYCFTAPQTLGLRFYDSNKTFVLSAVISTSGSTYTAPSNAAYLRFNCLNTTTYNHDICINLSDPAKNGTYEPYAGHLYPLDSSLILRGIPKWDSVKGTMYYDGDEYTSDGRVTWRYGIVNLGTLTWTHYEVETGKHTFQATLSGGKNAGNGICPKYRLYQTIYIKSQQNQSFMMYATSSTNKISIRDDAYTQAADFKAALSGVYLVYEMATPATDAADPYTGTQWVEAGGTEAFIDAGTETGRVAVPVGHDTFYPTDLRSKIERLPSDFSTLIAPTEATYTATRNYAVNALLIVDNTLYQVTSAIATGGTITPGTNVQATTLSELIAALQQ